MWCNVITEYLYDRVLSYSALQPIVQYQIPIPLPFWHKLYMLYSVLQLLVRCEIWCSQLQILCSCVLIWCSFNDEKPVAILHVCAWGVYWVEVWYCKEIRNSQRGPEKVGREAAAPGSGIMAVQTHEGPYSHGAFQYGLIWLCTYYSYSVCSPILLYTVSYTGYYGSELVLVTVMIIEMFGEKKSF